MFDIGDMIVIKRGENVTTPEQFINAIGKITKIRNSLRFAFQVEFSGEEDLFSFHKSELKLIKTNKKLK